jgi:hypothetical protein
MAILLEVEPAQGVTNIVPDYQGNFAALDFFRFGFLLCWAVASLD